MIVGWRFVVVDSYYFGVFDMYFEVVDKNLVVVDYNFVMDLMHLDSPCSKDFLAVVHVALAELLDFFCHYLQDFALKFLRLISHLPDHCSIQ